MTHEFAHCIVHMNNLYLKNNFESAYRTYLYEFGLIIGQFHAWDNYTSIEIKLS